MEHLLDRIARVVVLEPLAGRAPALREKLSHTYSRLVSMALGRPVEPNALTACCNFPWGYCSDYPTGDCYTYNVEWNGLLSACWCSGVPACSGAACCDYWCSNWGPCGVKKYHTIVPSC
jgi:hypothetical protein